MNTKWMHLAMPAHNTSLKNKPINKIRLLNLWPPHPRRVVLESIMLKKLALILSTLKLSNTHTLPKWWMLFLNMFVDVAIWQDQD